MKRYISVFEMITRSSIYKVILILLAMAGAETALFLFCMENLAGNNQNYLLEQIVTECQMVWVLLLAFVLITVVITLSGCNIGSTQGYTLQRLQIPEKRIFFLQALYNICCYILLWAAQLAVLLVCSRLYIQKAADVTNQTIYLAFHRNKLMHSILPLEDGIGWFMLAYIILGVGSTAAGFTFQQRKGKIGWEFFMMIGIVLIAFPRELGESITLYIVLLFIFPVQWVCQKAFGKEWAEYEEKKFGK